MDALLASAALCSILGSESIVLAGNDIRVRDVVELGCITPAMRDELGELIVAQAPANRARHSVSRVALAALVRRRVPALSGLSGGEGFVTLVAEAGPASRSAHECFATSQGIATGQALAADLLRSAPCADDEPTRGSLRYDRLAGVVRARVDLPAGAYVGPVLTPGELAADEHDLVELRVRNGATLVERTVIAAQPTLGPRTFLRSDDGQVFSAPSAALVEHGEAP